MDTKALRQKILDLAIRGKLVPQDPTDEPASVLLERIRAERQRLVKEGKLKAKDVKNDSIIYKDPSDNLHYEKFSDGTIKCIEDEIPFDIPEFWAWVRLNTCCAKEIKRGKAPKYILKSNTLVFAQKCNTKSGEIKLSLAQFLDEETLKKYTEDDFTQNNDIIINSTGTGTLGRVGIYTNKDNPSNLPIVPDSHITTVRVFGELNAKMVFLWLKFNQAYLEDQGEGSTNQKELRPNTLAEMLIPIPPLAEQLRIESSYNSIIYLMNYLDTKKLEVSKCVELTKSKILDLAIRGKLVPQDPNDEPASVLLERIKAEKEELIKQGRIKRDKAESTIFKGDDNSYYERVSGHIKNISEEIHYNLPNSWSWTRLDTIFRHNTGKALNSSDTKGDLHQYITTSNLYWGHFHLDVIKTMTFTKDEFDKCSIKKGDLLVCEGGDVGRAAIWQSNTPMCIQNHIHRLRLYYPLNTKFYYYVFFQYKNIGLIGGKGIGIQGLSSGVIGKLIFPLPPLAEQHRIVTAIETTFAELDKISTDIT